MGTSREFAQRKFFNREVKELHLLLKNSYAVKKTAFTISLLKATCLQMAGYLLKKKILQNEAFFIEKRFVHLGFNLFP